MTEFQLIDLQPKEQTKPVFDSWYQIMSDSQVMGNYSWDTILRVGVIYVFPFAVTAILLSWLIHGVGFVIVRR